MIILLWSLLTTPIDRLICSMWLSSPPTVADVRSACGVLEYPEMYTVQFIEIATGRLACEQPAVDLPGITCDAWPLNLYRMDVVQPDSQYHVCTIRVEHSGEPTTAEIAAQCPQAPATYELDYNGPQAPEPAPAAPCALPVLPTGPGIDDLPADPAGLATTVRLQYLAGRLLWFGIATPSCDGWSGINPSNGMASECGMTSAYPATLAWQNMLDAAIWTAGKDTNVPPRRIKQLLMVESQLWPLAEGPVGEVGMMQLSGNGADLVLRSSQDLYSDYCPRAVYPVRCATQTYDTLSELDRAAIRSALLADITPGPLLPVDAMRRSDMRLAARLLAGVWCAVQSTPHPGWDGVLAAWHSGYSCVSGAEICADGRDYLLEAQR